MEIQKLQQIIFDDSALKDLATAFGMAVETFRALCLNLYARLQQKEYQEKLCSADFRTSLYKELKDIIKAEKRREVNKRYARHTSREKPCKKPQQTQRCWQRTRSNPGLR